MGALPVKLETDVESYGTLQTCCKYFGTARSYILGRNRKNIIHLFNHLIPDLFTLRDRTAHGYTGALYLITLADLSRLIQDEDSWPQPSLWQQQLLSECFHSLLGDYLEVMYDKTPERCGGGVSLRHK